jgi:heavy metal sensor kinase
MGLRARLSLWCTAVLLVILACVSGGVYAFVRAGLTRTLDVQLDHDLDTVTTVIAAAPHGSGTKGHLPGDVLFVVNEGPRTIYHSNAWCHTRCLNGADADPADGEGVWRSPAGTDYRLRTVVRRVGGRNLTITVAEDMAIVQRTLRSLLATLLLSFPCAALLSASGGYWLAGRALAPIGAMAAKARHVSAESLSERLPVDGRGDELGRMACVFNDTLARLEASFERLRAFVANTSHELRTPLMAMRSVGEVALQRPPDAASARDAIGSMLEEVDRLTRLVEGLLGLARAESGGTRLPREDVDLAEMTVSVASLLRVLAEEKRQDLKVDAAQPVIVEADPATLRHALISLLDNAIRYTPAGGHVSLRAAFAHDGTPLIEVEDDGPGIAPQDCERIFDRFYRARDGAQGETDGTGLGLAIARAAVQANRGRLEYERVPAGGSRFRISFKGRPA